MRALHPAKIEAIVIFLENCVEQWGDTSSLVPKMMELARSTEVLGIVTRWNTKRGVD